MVPKDLPPWETVYWYFARWRADGSLDRLHDALRDEVRTKREKRDPEPSAGIVDSQSVKGADTVSSSSRGSDAGKRINGPKRHIVVDTIGLLLVVMVTTAAVQDRDGGRSILGACVPRSPRSAGVRRWRLPGPAGGGRQARLGDHGRGRAQAGRPARLLGPAPSLGRRAHLAWLMRFRRLVRDYEPAARDRRGDDQVGDGRDHAQPSRSSAGTEAVVEAEA